MENIKNFVNLTIGTLVTNTMNFCMYLLMHTPLKSMDEGYLFFFAGTIVAIVGFIIVGVPIGGISFFIEALFCPGETILKKIKYRMEKKRIRSLIRQKEWPDSFLCRYLNRLNYIMAFFVTISSFLLKSPSLLWIGLPSLVLIIVHDNRIKKKFNYELYAYKDLSICLLAIYITIFLIINYLVNHNL